MSTTVSFNVKDIQNPVQVASEYTDKIVNTYWAPRFQTIATVFAKNPAAADTGPDAPPPPPPLSDQDPIDLWNAINDLKNAAVNGIDTATGLPVPAGQQPQGKRAFLTIDMASSLDKMIRALDSVGFDTVNPPTFGDPSLITELKRWQDLDNVGLRDILIKMGDAIDSNRTLQALIELEYVKTGNDLIGGKLQDLDQALKITKNILDALSTAQTLHNKIEAETRKVNDKNAEYFTFVPSHPIKYDPPTIDQALYPSGLSNVIDNYNVDVNLYQDARDQLNNFLAGQPVDGVTKSGPIDTPEEMDELRNLVITYNSVAGNLETQRNTINNGVTDPNLLIGYTVPTLIDVPADDVIFSPSGHDSGTHYDSRPYWTVKMFDLVGQVNDPGSTVPNVGDAFADNDYQQGYQNALKMAFDSPLGVQVNVTGKDVNDFIAVQNKLVQLKDQLTQINSTSPLIDKINTVLSNMAQAPSDTNDILAGSQPLIMTDSGQVIGTNAQNPLNRLLFWISDDYQAQDAIDAGINQRNLTDAITSAQGLNDQQKQDLQRFMYLFEQFYKSASSMLQAIDQMVGKMAQNIKG